MISREEYLEYHESAWELREGQIEVEEDDDNEDIQCKNLWTR